MCFIPGSSSSRSCGSSSSSLNLLFYGVCGVRLTPVRLCNRLHHPLRLIRLCHSLGDHRLRRRHIPLGHHDRLCIGAGYHRRGVRLLLLLRQFLVVATAASFLAAPHDGAYQEAGEDDDEQPSAEHRDTLHELLLGGKTEALLRVTDETTMVRRRAVIGC